ncbi:Uncharacterised protein [Chromobacterium violaceum]|uniref:Uncharacterized protein n=1 Tax=Chromobacterium violaceum TaxID=536 RepID=A0A447TGX9_CHRVL|nr:Uncharacterised protein [Chromobacterium violaceum]
MYSIAWRKPDGSRLWWFWSENPGEAMLKGIARATLRQPLSGACRVLRAEPEGLRVPVAPQLQMLEWRP